jgi:hypothetical protein
LRIRAPLVLGREGPGNCSGSLLWLWMAGRDDLATSSRSSWWTRAEVGLSRPPGRFYDRKQDTRAEALDPSLAEPVLEAGLGESGVVAGHECALLQFYAEVARLRIGDHFAWIAAFPEESSDKFV